MLNIMRGKKLRPSTPNNYCFYTAKFFFVCHGIMHDASIALEGAPRAGLNYLFFDKGMNLLPMSGVLTLGGLSPNVFNSLSMGEPVAATEPGYLIVYVDNQSLGKDVWFDNIQILHYNAEVQEETHYYPFGLALTSSAMGVTEQPYKYQGIELEKHFGYEMYETFPRSLDPQLGRFNSIDPKAEKYYSFSPYVSMGNNPVSYIDPLGDDIYMLYYTTGNESGDDMFKAAAETRKNAIEGGKNFNSEKDIVLMVGVSDISKIGEHTESAVNTYSEKYGQTAEVGVWSHSGFDGPIGTESTSQNALYEGSTQMSLEGWGNINFNWKEGGTIGFYGCNSGNESSGKSFAQNISSLNNFKGIEVWGQTTSSYPSFYSNIRVTSIARNYNLPGAWSFGELVILIW
jgi:RHS repeat-associated protein